MAEIKIVPDQDALAEAAARYFVAAFQDAVRQQGRFRVALSGGSTPRRMHTLLASEPFAQQIDWSLVDVFWSDERCVPPDHPDSNYRMAHDTLLNFVPILASNIYRIPAELSPAGAAASYAKTLHTVFTDAPRMDLLFLGMGDDGHTASLFPGTSALNEYDRWVVANYVEKLAAWRITWTAAAINAAARIAFLVAGKEKSQRLHEVLRGAYDPQNLPSQLIKPENGELLWLIDQAAATAL